MLSQKKLIYKPLNSTYQVLSAEACTKHGLNVHAVIFDEFHALPDKNFFEVMTRASGMSRRQPLYFIITTAGNSKETICWNQHQKAVDILDGKRSDPRFYPVIYGAQEDDDWQDEEVWKRANPSIGVTCELEDFRAMAESARSDVGEENSFKQLNLNIWVNTAVRWMPTEVWRKCAFPVVPERLRGRECYGGLDLSHSNDITAFVLVFPPENPDDEDDKYQILPFFWIAEEQMALRIRRDHVNYDQWQRDEFLQVTPGNVIQYSFIEEFIKKLYETYDIREIAFDRWGAFQMAQRLKDAGMKVIDFGQGYESISPPTKELMRLSLDKRIAHGGHPVLDWMMGNVYVENDAAGNIKPNKDKSTEKIDGVVATIMALDRAIRQVHGAYDDDRGLFTLDDDGYY